MAGDTDLGDGTCRPRKVPAALWWHFCEAVCSLAGSPYPAQIIKHLHSHKILLLLILWKMYKISDSLTFASPQEVTMSWREEHGSADIYTLWRDRLCWNCRVHRANSIECFMLKSLLCTICNWCEHMFRFIFLRVLPQSGSLYFVSTNVSHFIWTTQYCKYQWP